jgi:hypothetical protein
VVVRYRGAEEVPGEPPPEGIPKPFHQQAWIGPAIIGMILFLIVVIGMASMMSQHS